MILNSVHQQFPRTIGQPENFHYIHRHILFLSLKLQNLVLHIRLQSALVLQEKIAEKIIKKINFDHITVRYNFIESSFKCVELNLNAFIKKPVDI